MEKYFNRLSIVFFCFIFTNLVVSQENNGLFLLETSNIRWGFQRGEEVNLDFKVTNLSGADIKSSSLKFVVEGIIDVAESLPLLKNNAGVTYRFTLDTLLLKAGEYQLSVILFSGSEQVATKTYNFWVARRWNTDRIPVWLWPHAAFFEAVEDYNEDSIKILDWYADKGFNVMGPALRGQFTNIAELITDKTMKLYDYMLYNGLEASFCADNGFWIELESDDPDAKFELRRPLLGQTLLTNPFHPEVARKQDLLNEKLMQKIGEFPGLTMCFVAGELEDRLPSNLPLSREIKPLGNTVEHRFIAPGVIADNDEGYLNNLYRYRWGDGLAIGGERLSDMVHHYRPDIRVFSDPIRRTTVYDRFRGTDLVSTWTYTNPDPKQMLFIETLVSLAKGGKQKGVMPTVTLLNYAGTLAPTENGWTIMGPDRLIETSWINLSRNPDGIGYYISSMLDPIRFMNEPNSIPYQYYSQTYDAMKEFSDNILKPYGPMIRKLERTNRKVAVLSSDSSRVYSDSPNLRGYYDNYQIYSFYRVLSMSHIAADVVFDQTIAQFGLDDYDVLVLPKCDTLIESVYNKILDFQARGGVVISDQYLRADIPDTIRFDFDFASIGSVSAKAIAESLEFVGGGDDRETRESSIKEVKASTALQEQEMMLGFAEEFRVKTQGIVDRDVDCDSPLVLLNLLEKDGVKYLFVINDKRTYDDRFGKYKAMLGKGISQTVKLTLNNSLAEYSIIYDIISHKTLPITKIPEGIEIEVELPSAGGKILALTNQLADGIDILSPDEISQRGKYYTIDILVRDSSGLLFQGSTPLKVDIVDAAGVKSEFSDFFAAVGGKCSLDFVAATNDESGIWQIEVTNLMTGKRSKKSVEIK